MNELDPIKKQMREYRANRFLKGWGIISSYATRSEFCGLCRRYNLGYNKGEELLLSKGFVVPNKSRIMKKNNGGVEL